MAIDLSPKSVQARWPGVGFVLVIALVATGLASWLADLPPPMGRLPISAMLIAIVLGLLVGHRVRHLPQLTRGLDWAKGPLLKTAVALVGFRLSLNELLSVGWQALPLIGLMIITGLALVLGLGRLFGVPPRLTLLLAAGTSICGASAIAVTSPAVKAHHEETCYAIGTIGLLGLIAILLYPLILQQVLVEPELIGLALGGVIHDTAQVTAAAVYHQQLWPNDQTLDTATVAKLMRNSTMVVVIPLLVWGFSRFNQNHQVESEVTVPFPWFIVAFLLLSIVRSVGDQWFETQSAGAWEAWMAWVGTTHQLSLLGFAMAMSALAMSVSPREVHALGMRGFWIAAVATLVMFAFALLWLS